MSTPYLCVIYFLSRSFLAGTHFVILYSGYRFAEGIRSNCKEVVDLQFVHPKSARLSGIFLSKSTGMKLVYKLVGTLFTSCSLFSACFSFSLILFCLPGMCACAIFRENQNKCKPSIKQLVHMFTQNEVLMTGIYWLGCGCSD